MTDEELDQRPDVQRSRALLAKWEREAQALAKGGPVDWSSLPARDFLAVAFERDGVIGLEANLGIPAACTARLLKDLKRRGIAQVVPIVRRKPSNGREWTRDSWVVDLARALELPQGLPADLVGLFSSGQFKVVAERDGFLEAGQEQPPAMPTQAPEPLPASAPRVGACSACGLEKELRRDGRCGGCFWGGFHLKVRGAGLEMEGAKEPRKPRAPRERKRSWTDDDSLTPAWGHGDADDTSEPAEIAPARSQEPAEEKTEMHKLTCQYPPCGKSFTSIRAWAKFDSPECKRAAHSKGAIGPRAKPAVAPKPKTKKPAARAGQRAQVTATSTLAEEIAAMQAVSQAVAGVETELAVRALRWVLDRLDPEAPEEQEEDTQEDAA